MHMCKCGHGNVAHESDGKGECFFSYNCDCKQFDGSKHESKRKCLTPGAVYHTEIGYNFVSVKVDIPGELHISEEDSEAMEQEIHDAIEAILARRWEKVVK